jgi:G3E family GTPase
MDARLGRNAKVPVIILTGFLGAGKTTLLNRLLTGDHGRRIAVIVNEFGEVGIDHHLLLTSDQEVVQMNNGCMCCTVRGDLVRSLFQLIELRAKFDTVIIETSGLAEPAPVAQSLYADENIRREFALGGVVTLVDAKNIASCLDESGEAQEQIAFADLVLLNKFDLASAEELDETERKISRLNRLARIVRTRSSELDLNEIFALEMQGLTSKADADAEASHDGPHKDGHHGHHGHGHHHLQGIDTVSLVDQGQLDHMKVSMWFRGLIAESGKDILRMKGILHLRGDAEQFLIQGVRTDFQGGPGRAWSRDENRLNRLVFIGRGLDYEKLKTGFQSCMADGNESRPGTTDPFGRFIEISPLALEQIRYWVRQNFNFSGDTPILIKEVPCVKPGCPPIETAIVAIVKNAPPRNFKVQRPINEVTFDHVYDLMENPMPCC